jgi:hypothetical protein
LLKADATGLYAIHVSDKGKGAQVNWPIGTKVVIPSSQEQRTLLRGFSDLYFYVPKGTKTIGGFGSGRGDLFDGDGKERKLVYDGSGYFNVPVPAGQDGKLWKFSRSDGMRILMTVPPYLAQSAAELLLPREVVEVDAR